MGRFVSFGAKQWMIWTPTLLLSVTSTAVAASSTTSVPSTAAFGRLVITLISIRRNLSSPRTNRQ
ncbi:hypothetical protein EDD15DRAFT_2332974, partial [Pisolithus albus]